MKKRKKIWITISCVILGLIAVILSGYFLTKLSSVSVEFRTRLGENETRLEENILDKVKASGDFNYKKSILFLNTKASIDKIEKENPYVKVTQVVRKFPNKLHVYISEREPKYRVKSEVSSSEWFILDNDFKVLDCVSDTSLFLDNTVEIEYFKIKAYVGDFIENNQEKENLNNILSGVYGKTKDYFAVKSINFSSENNTFYLTMKNGLVNEEDSSSLNYAGGCEIQIEGLSNLKEKAYSATSVYTGDKFTNSDGSEIDIKKLNLTLKTYIIINDYGCKIKN